MIVLDTSILSLALRRRWTGARPSSVERLEEMMRAQAALAIPGIVLQEVLSGIRVESQFSSLQTLLHGIPLLIASGGDHTLAAKIFNQCLDNGVSASHIDCLIAAQTIACHGRLWTLDRDFAAIARCSRLKFFRPA